MASPSSFYFVVACFPLALYAIALSWAHRRSTPFAVDGRNDFIAIALALSGVFFVGPGQAAVPYGAVLVWHKTVWILCAALYICLVVLISSALRPRIVVYNTTREQLRKTLATIAVSLDDEARWAGSSLNLPSLSVQLYVDASGFGRVASLVGVGPERSAQGWRRLETELTRRLKESESTTRGWSGLFFAAIGWGTLALVAWRWIQDYSDISETFRFFLSV